MASSNTLIRWSPAPKFSDERGCLDCSKHNTSIKFYYLKAFSQTLFLHLFNIKGLFLYVI
jgi:hypothetical protein